VPTKKIPVSLNKNDYNFLNYIQQGSLYSGNSVSSMVTISDILKSTVLHSMLNVYTSWENYGSKTIGEFLHECGQNNLILPKTQQEFSLDMKNLINVKAMESIVRNFKDVSINSTMGKTQEKSSVPENVYGSEPLNKPGTTNFILALNEGEMAIFDAFKIAIDKYRNSETSYSEMTRILFRNLFINVNREDNYKNLERFSMLSSFYIMGLYGFNAVESTLLLHGLTEFHVKISKEKLERLKIIYSDETIFNLYLEELKNVANKELKEKDRKSKFQRKQNIDYTYPIDNVSLNNMLDEKYRSAVSGFNFHSAYLGYHLLDCEWFFGQHKLPLLVSYFNGSNETGLPLSHLLTPLSLQSFEEGFKDLYSSSKAYRENPGNILKVKG
jgi:hypothetical protein